MHSFCNALFHWKNHGTVFENKCCCGYLSPYYTSMCMHFCALQRAILQRTLVIPAWFHLSVFVKFPGHGMKISCLGTVSFSFRDKMAMCYGLHFTAIVLMLLTLPVSASILSSLTGSSSRMLSVVWTAEFRSSGHHSMVQKRWKKKMKSLNKAGNREIELFLLWGCSCLFTCRSQAYLNNFYIMQYFAGIFNVP